MKHIHFVIHRLGSIFITYCCYFFFLDGFLPLSRLLIFNPHGLFKLEKRKMIFQMIPNIYHIRSLVLKERISNEILEVFVLFLLIFSILFMFYRKIKHKGNDWISFFYFFFFLFILSRIGNYSLIKSEHMSDKLDSLLGRLRLFLFNDILFCIYIFDFKVWHIVLMFIVHVLNMEINIPNILQNVFFIISF
jgi:hypothetical protein